MNTLKEFKIEGIDIILHQILQKNPNSNDLMSHSKVNET